MWTGLRAMAHACATLCLTLSVGHPALMYAYAYATFPNRRRPQLPATNPHFLNCRPATPLRCCNPAMDPCAAMDLVVPGSRPCCSRLEGFNKVRRSAVSKLLLNTHPKGTEVRIVSLSLVRAKFSVTYEAEGVPGAFESFANCFEGGRQSVGPGDP